MDNSKYIGIPYDEGRDDCYGLLRRYYMEEYGIELTNYARPKDFVDQGLDLIQENFLLEGFQVVDVSVNLLELGDVLLMRLGARYMTVNHVGVYVGARRFLHHVVDSPSTETVFSSRWTTQIMTKVRHPLVTEINRDRRQRFNFLDVVPVQMREEYERSNKLLGGDSGEVRGDPEQRGDSGTEEQAPEA